MAAMEISGKDKLYILQGRWSWVGKLGICSTCFWKIKTEDTNENEGERGIVSGKYLVRVD